MFNFQSERNEREPEKVPYFEDATAANGWQGQTTGKSIETLKSEIISHIGKLGGLTTGFERGSFGNRSGYRIHYVIETPEGKHIPGYIDVAALPNKPMMRHYSRRHAPETSKEDKALRMALFNVAECLGSLWKLQRLSPGFAPLMPFMIVQGGQNLTQVWSTSNTMKALMPPSDNFSDGQDAGEIVEGEVTEA